MQRGPWGDPGCGSKASGATQPGGVLRFIPVGLYPPLWPLPPTPLCSRDDIPPYPPCSPSLSTRPPLPTPPAVVHPVLPQLREAGDFSAASTRLYEHKWKEAYGHDFPLVGGWVGGGAGHLPTCENALVLLHCCHCWHQQWCNLPATTSRWWVSAAACRAAQNSGSGQPLLFPLLRLSELAALVPTVPTASGRCRRPFHLLQG